MSRETEPPPPDYIILLWFSICLIAAMYLGWESGRSYQYYVYDTQQKVADRFIVDDPRWEDSAPKPRFKEPQ